jgi:PAS domain S-box-containing protein
MKSMAVQTERDAAPARGRGGASSAVEVITSLVGSDRLLDLILNNTADLIVILDKDGRRIYNSPSYREVLGEPDALRGTIAFAEIHPDDRDQIQKLFQQTVRTGKGKRAEFRFLLADGTVKHIESRGHIIRDLKKEIRYVVVISRDITSQKHTRMQLAETEATFRGLVENSFVGVFIIQGDKFTYVNPRFCKILGYDAGELVGRMKLTDVVVSEDRNSVEENIQRHLAGETPRIWYSFHALRKDGVTIGVEIAGARTVHNGQPAIVGTVIDITERKRAESLRHALYSITERASSVTQLTDFYAAVHGILGELMYVRNFYIALYDRESEYLTFPYFVDEYDPPPPPHKPGRGLTEYVLRTGKPLLATPEVFQDLLTRGEVVLVGGASVDWLGVPLMEGDTAVGVIVIQSYTDTVRFGRKEQEILTYISHHIAVAIDRKRTEAALRESEERHRAIISGMGDGVLFHDPRGMLSSWNPGALRILDLSEDELQGWPYQMKGADPIHEDLTPFLPGEYPAAVTRLTGSPCTNAVLGFRTRTGERRWISINTQPHIRPGGGFRTRP